MQSHSIARISAQQAHPLPTNSTKILQAANIFLSPNIIATITSNLHLSACKYA